MPLSLFLDLMTNLPFKHELKKLNSSNGCAYWFVEYESKFDLNSIKITPFKWCKTVCVTPYLQLGVFKWSFCRKIVIDF